MRSSASLLGRHFWMDRIKMLEILMKFSTENLTENQLAKHFSIFSRYTSLHSYRRFFPCLRH